jgi:hypothetical protein
MIIRQIKKRPVQQQVSVDMEGIFAQQAQTRRAAERVTGRLRYEAEWIAWGTGVATGGTSGSFGAFKGFRVEKRMREQLGFDEGTKFRPPILNYATYNAWLMQTAAEKRMREPLGFEDGRAT